MSVVSDPSLRAAPRAHGAHFAAGPGSPPVASDLGVSPPVRPSSRSRMAVYASLAVVTVALGLRVLASLFARPLETLSVSRIAPRWMIEVTTTNATPTTALLYGSDVGVQLVRVPAGRGSTDAPRLVPARLANGELHVISLDLAPLHVHASAPQGAAPMSFDAASPIITAYHRAPSACASGGRHQRRLPCSIGFRRGRRVPRAFRGRGHAYGGDPRRPRCLTLR